MFTIKLFFWVRGPPLPSPFGYALASLVQSLARVKIWGAAPPKVWNVVSRKMSTWVGQYEPLELFCSWTKVHLIFFARCGRGCWWSNFYPLSTCRSVPEIFAIKFESCQKNARILDVFFAVPKFRGRVFQKLCTHYHSCLAARCLEKFREDTLTIPEVIEAHTLIIKAKF